MRDLIVLTRLPRIAYEASFDERLGHVQFFSKVSNIVDRKSDPRRKNL